MPALTNLDLSGNALSGTLPVSAVALCNTAGVSCNLGGGSNAVLLDLSTLAALPHSTASISVSGTPWSLSSVTGALPNLAALTALTSLVISSQGSLTGQLSDIFPTMAALTNLDLSNNALSGTLPLSAITLCSKAGVTCNFAGNLLTVAFSAFLTALASNATSFSVSSWGATMQPGPIPNLAAYTALTAISLSSASLTGAIPPSLAALTGLKSLDLSSNALNGTIPDTWAGLTGLTNLNLDYNSLSGSLPQSFSSLVSAIQLRNNAGLNGTINYALLTNCADYGVFSAGLNGPACSLAPGTGLSLPAAGSSSSGSGAAAFDPTSLLAAISSLNASQAAQAAQFSSSSAMQAAQTSNIVAINTTLAAGMGSLNATQAAQATLLSSMNATLAALAAQLSMVNATLSGQAATSGGAPRSLAVALGGYTEATFGTAAQAAFAAAVASTTGASASSVTFNSVATADEAPAGGRHLMAAAGVNVGFTVTTPMPFIALATLVASQYFNTTVATSYAAAGLPTPFLAAVNGVASVPAVTGTAGSQSASQPTRPTSFILVVLAAGAALVV